MMRTIAAMGVVCLLGWSTAPPSTPATLTPTVVPWPTTPVRLSEAIGLWKQTGNVVLDLRETLGQPAADSLLTAPPPPMTFWRTLIHAAGSAQLRFTPRVDAQTQRGELVLTHAETPLPPTHIDGPFLGLLERISSTRSFGEPGLSQLGVTIRLHWEPRLRPIFGRFSANDAALCLGDDTELTADGLAGVRRLAGESHLDLALRFPLPTQRGNLRWVRLRGELVVAPGDVVVRGKAGPGPWPATPAGVAAEVLKTNYDRFAQIWRTELRVRYPAETMDLESHQTWAMESARLALAAPDEPPRRGELTEIRIEDRAIIMAFLVRQVPVDPTGRGTVVLTIPAAPVRHRLQLRFEDVPLP